jgi:hypothetical protein
VRLPAKVVLVVAPGLVLHIVFWAQQIKDITVAQAEVAVVLRVLALVVGAVVALEALVATG